MTRFALPRSCLALLALAFLGPGCATQQAANGAAPQTVTIKSSAKSAYEKKSVGGGALYTFRYTSRVTALAAQAAEAEDEENELTEDSETDTETDEAQEATNAESACRKNAPCGCDGVRDGEAGLVFYPEGEILRVEWKQLRGLPGPFDAGSLARDGQGAWKLLSAPPRAQANCVVEHVESDQLDRFIGFTLRCESEDSEQGCRLEELLAVRFVSPLDAPPQSVPVKELPLIEDQSPAPSGS